MRMARFRKKSLTIDAFPYGEDPAKSSQDSMGGGFSGDVSRGGYRC